MSSRSSDLSDESDIEIDFGDDYSNCRGENDMNIYLEQALRKLPDRRTCPAKI